MRWEEAPPVSAPSGRAISAPNTTNQPADASLAAPPFPGPSQVLRHPRVDGATRRCTPSCTGTSCRSEPPGKDPRHGASTPRSSPSRQQRRTPTPQHRPVCRRTRGTGRSCCGAAQGRRRCVTQRGAPVPVPRLALPSEQANMCAPSLFTHKHTRPRAAAAGRHRNQQRLHELWRKSTAAKSGRIAAASHALPAPCAQSTGQWPGCHRNYSCFVQLITGTAHPSNPHRHVVTAIAMVFSVIAMVFSVIVVVLSC